MKNRRYYFKFLVGSLGLLTLPIGTFVNVLNNMTDHSEKSLNALDLIEKLAHQSQKTCVYFAGASTDFKDLFKKRPSLVSDKIYINDDPDIMFDEIVSQVNQLIDHKIHVDYVIIQNNYLKVNPIRISTTHKYSFLICSESTLHSFI
jgi:hypothetical protein